MRKPIQLVEGPVVLCDDGTIWQWTYATGVRSNCKSWEQMPPIPQPKEETARYGDCETNPPGRRWE